MNPSLTALERLKQHWLGQPNLRFRPGLSLGAIRTFEMRCRVVLPEVVKQYFMFANGFAPPHDQDLQGFRFWSLEEMQPVSSYKGGRFGNMGSVFLFADYMAWSWGYGLDLQSDGVPVYLFGTRDGRPNRVASSFEEFVDLYIADDAAIYCP